MTRDDRGASSFDDLARALAEGSISRRRALKLFAGTALAALIPSRALAHQQKVTICHKPGTPAEKTMEVPKSAVDGHLGHGDHPGPCGTTTPTSTSTTSTSTSTTPTTSTSTSTTTPTTSTSTSTTSTSTTPMCIANGGTCSSGTQCCSGKCKSGTCVASCIPPNAIGCDPLNSDSCPGGSIGGCLCSSASEGGGYCSTGIGTGTPCSTSCDCPAGQFCQPGEPTSFCAVAAEMCPRVPPMI
jgi:hypothetical protein